MAKLSRVYQRLFASTATSTDVGQFGSLAAASPTTTTDPTTIMSLSNWLAGWKAAIVGGNNPALEDLNGMCLVFAYQLGYLFQQGVPEWDTTTVYYKGSRVLSTTSGLRYVSIADSNQGNAVTNASFWALDSNYNAILGSATEVSAGLATHSTWASVIAAASTNWYVKVRPGAWTENVADTKSIFWEGSGYASQLTGTFTMQSCSRGQALNFRVSGTVTVDSGSSSCLVDKLWQPSPIPNVTVKNQGTNNFIGVVMPA